MSTSLPEHYREILVGLGENPDREGLLDTPKRAAKAMQYLCHGYGQSLEDIVNGALFASDSDEMVIVADDMGNGDFGFVNGGALPAASAADTSHAVSLALTVIVRASPVAAVVSVQPVPSSRPMVRTGRTRGRIMRRLLG